MAVPLLPDEATYVCPGIVTTKYLCAPKVCESDQKFVTLFVIHAMVAVPGFPEVLRIFHVEGKIFPVIAWT